MVKRMKENSSNTQTKNQSFRFAKFCALFSAVSILFIYFQWDVGVNLFGLFLFLVLPFLVLILGILIITSIIYIFVQVKNNSWKAFLPLVINIVTVLVFIFVPLVHRNMDFFINRQAYKDVAQKILDREISLDEHGGLLPLQYQYLSAGHSGMVSIEKSQIDTQIYFMRFEDVLGCTVDGFMYSTNDIVPPTRNDIFVALTAQKIEPHWFSISGNYYDC